MAMELVDIAHATLRDESLAPQERVIGFLDTMIKDPRAWASGQDPMSTAQLSYLSTLARGANARPDIDVHQLIMDHSGETTEQLIARIQAGQVRKGEASILISIFQAQLFRENEDYGELIAALNNGDQGPRRGLFGRRRDR